MLLHSRKQASLLGEKIIISSKYLSWTLFVTLLLLLLWRKQTINVWTCCRIGLLEFKQLLWLRPDSQSSRNTCIWDWRVKFLGILGKRLYCRIFLQVWLEQFFCNFQANAVGCNSNISRIRTIASVHKKGDFACCDSFVHYCNVDGCRYIYTGRKKSCLFWKRQKVLVTKYYGHWKKALNHKKGFGKNFSENNGGKNPVWFCNEYLIHLRAGCYAVNSFPPQGQSPGQLGMAHLPVGGTLYVWFIERHVL